MPIDEPLGFDYLAMALFSQGFLTEEEVIAFKQSNFNSIKGKNCRDFSGVYKNNFPRTIELQLYSNDISYWVRLIKESNCIEIYTKTTEINDTFVFAYSNK